MPPRGPDASRFTALMINGGGNPSVNYQAHLAHLRELRALLLDGGVPSEKITLFSADGADPAPDSVSREAQPEADFWRLHGTPVEHALETPRVIVSSEIPGAELHAATKAGIAAWFDQAKPKLHGGDVLLLYVTDHGLSGGRDPLDNTILLWNKETLSVRELGAMIDGLDPGVRVVMLMSQCYSGGFASLSLARRAGPLVCGYFASTADRPAYGCFPENRGKEKAGHAFQFIRALAATRRMEDAQAAVLVGDDTPDVPIRSSDVYLEAALARAAKARGITLAALASEILPGPEATPGREVVQRIAASAGLPAPGKLAEVDALRASLPDLARRLDRSATAWHGALGDANTGNLGAFLADHPAWARSSTTRRSPRISPPRARSPRRSSPTSRRGPRAARAAAPRSCTSARRPPRPRRTAPRCASPPRSASARSSWTSRRAPTSRAARIPPSERGTRRSAPART